jgi:hypothetical protein
MRQGTTIGLQFGEYLSSRGDGKVELLMSLLGPPRFGFVVVKDCGGRLSRRSKIVDDEFLLDLLKKVAL